MTESVNEAGETRNALKGGSLKTLRRGLDVLSLFSDRPEWTQSAIAQATGLPMPTVYRLCSTLVEAGWLERERNGSRLRGGLSLIALASRTLSSLSPVDLVVEHLQALADSTGETANLATLAGSEVLYLRSVAGERLLRPQVAAGLRVPAYCTAIGKCLLSQLAPSDAREVVGPEPYLARTEHTLTSWRQLSAALEHIRTTGIAESDEEWELGLYSIAHAIPSVEGGSPCGISVAPPTTRATKNDRRLLIVELRRAADAIALAMGLLRA